MSGDGATVRFLTDQLEEQMTRMVEELRIAGPKIVKVEAFQLLKAIVRFTHPDSKSQGRRAVQRDIKRAIQPLDPARFVNPRIAEMIRSNNIPAFSSIMRNVPQWKDWEVFEFDRSFHTSARNNRGRVTYQRKRFTLNKRSWKQYVSSQQAQVGSAKATWNVAYNITGGSNLPEWVASHMAEGRYATTVSRLDSAHKPMIQITSSALGIVNDPEFDSALKRALETRVHAMRSKISRMLRDPLKYSNLFSQYQ